MRAAGPAAWPALSFFEFRADPPDMVAPRLLLLDGRSPADPLIARERCKAVPFRKHIRIGSERFP